MIAAKEAETTANVFSFMSESRLRERRRQIVAPGRLYKLALTRPYSIKIIKGRQLPRPMQLLVPIT
jgi:hypothetical protein